MSGVPAVSRSNPLRRPILPLLALFSLAVVPRILNLSAYVAADEAKWILRSAHFLSALLTGHLAAAASQAATPDVDVLAPGVTTMWLGALGLLAKYWADGATLPLIDFLAALLSTDSERVTLDFYPWLRLPTVLATSLFIVAFYVMVRRLFPHGRIALLAAILLALDPFFLNHSRVIHHDALTAVCMSLSLLALLIHFQGRGGQRWLLLSGVLLGLSVLTKPTALILLPFGVLMGLWQTFARRELQESAGRWEWEVWGWLALWAVVALLTFVVAWPALWGDPLGTLSRLVGSALTAAGGDQGEALMPRLVPNRVPELGALFYPVNWVLRWGILPAVGLLLVPLAWRRTASGATRSSVAWLAIYSLLLMLALVPLGTRDIRYYLPAWPALMTLAAFGLAQVPVLGHPVATAILSVALLIPYYPYYVTYYNPIVGGPYLAPKLVKVGGGEGMDQVAAYLNAQPGIREKTVASTMLESFLPYFEGNVAEHHSQTYADVVVNYIRQVQNGNPSDEYLAYFAARAPDHTVRLGGIEYANVYFEPSPRPVRDVAFGNIRLVAQTLDRRFGQPGQRHQVTLLWQAPAQAGEDRVRLKVRDLTGKAWSESEGALLAPEGPSAVEGHYTLDLPSDMPRGDYPLWVTLGDGQDWIQIGTIPVHSFASPAEVPNPLEVDFSRLIALRGFSLSDASPAPGETLTLRLFWQALQPIPESYTMFVHLVDAAGNRVAQSDVVPGNGQWPTDTWQPGEWITDEVRLALPATLQAAEYDLLVGMYQWNTGERLPVVGDASGDNAVKLARIGIE